MYDKAWDFSNTGLACIENEGTPCIINLRGEQLVEPFWVGDQPDSFREGVARYVGETGKIGFYNAKGEVVIAAKWNHAEPFSNGLALVNNGGKLEQTEDGTRSVKGGLWGAIDDLGRIALKIDFPQLHRGPANTFRVSENDSWFRPGGNAVE